MADRRVLKVGDDFREFEKNEIMTLVSFDTLVTSITDYSLLRRGSSASLVFSNS